MKEMSNMNISNNRNKGDLNTIMIDDNKNPTYDIPCPEIILDQKGICINGVYQILLASSLFYFRIPVERWAQRMSILKAAGYNTIDVYFPWNFHETSPGKWDFIKQHDVSHFLSLAAAHDLFVIARPGPYICSEWDGGALPAWLHSDGIHVRQDNPEFLHQMNLWYEQILPLIAPYQIAKGGTVLCMQIENELDFYDCKSPVSYMEKLMEKVRLLGIEVPLFYCCGQNDLLRGGGLSDGLVTAYNVYADSASSGVEERVRHLYQTVSSRGLPLLVTETNREHSFLKRLLSCGARLLSPYNQTAGSTTDWYNGITNWGSAHSPISLLSTDYDFVSMVGSAGDVTSQFTEARLFAGLLHCMGEALALSVPGISALAYLITGEMRIDSLPVLETKQGCFLAVSNLGTAREMTLFTEDFSCILTMPAGYTSLLPYHFELSSDLEVILCCSSYELCWFHENDSHITAYLYGSGSFQALVRIQGNQYPIYLTDIENPVSHSIGCITFVLASSAVMAAMDIPGLSPISVLPGQQRSTTELSSISFVPYHPAPSCFVKTEIMPMEKLGQYRGVSVYSFTLHEPADFLLYHAADILTIRRDGTLLETTYGRCSCLERGWLSGDYEIRTEIWGHSNFDDIRCRCLHMDSLKGLEQLVEITSRLDLTDNWYFDLDEQPITEWYFFRHSPYNTIIGIDGYNRAASPLKSVYDKWIEIPPGNDSLFLHFSKADCMIDVYVNGHFQESVLQDDPYVDISRYAGETKIEICLRIQRRYFSDEAGIVTLLAGKKRKDCCYAPLPVESIIPADVRNALSPENAVFPVFLPAAQEILLVPDLPEPDGKDVKLVFEGQQVKLTVILKNHIVGRLVLENNILPVVKGGRNDTVFLCGDWLLDDDPVIWCQPLGDYPMISRITYCSYTPVTGL